MENVLCVKFDSALRAFIYFSTIETEINIHLGLNRVSILGRNNKNKVSVCMFMMVCIYIYPKLNTNTLTHVQLSNDNLT